jgi:hypothetical protein
MAKTPPAKLGRKGLTPGQPYCVACGAEIGPKRKSTCSQRCAASLATRKRAEYAATPGSKTAIAVDKFRKRTWEYAADSREAKANRGKVWIEPTDRPRVANPIRQGTVTQYGKVAAAGMNAEGQRYYMLIDVATGAITQMPADVLEAGR